MGYKPTSTTYALEFEDKPGLEVRCKGATLGEIDKVRKLEPNMNEPDEAKRMAIFTFFEKKLITWNVDHPELVEEDENGRCASCGLKEDEPMPCTVLSMQCLELAFIMRIIIGWVFAVARVSVPKGLNLSNGAPNGQGLPLPDGLTEQIMRELENLQNPMPLPEPNFT